MLDIVFLSRVIPLSMKNEVLSKRKGTMSESGESLQWKIIEGLEANLHMPVQMLNYIPVQSYPSSYTDAYIRQSQFSHTAGAQDINLPFINVQYIKRLFMGKSLYRAIKKWASNNSGAKKVILSYSLTPEFCKAIELAKRIDPTISSCAVVADLPQYTILTKKMSIGTKVYLNWMKTQTGKRLANIDCFTLLTEQMADELVVNQPYVVMEGICTVNIPQGHPNNPLKTILYAGTLHERFGILQLLDAFKLIPNEDYRLVICGVGDCEKVIRSTAAKDSRIHFMGQLPWENVLHLMGTSSVIVNPRSSNEAFTKYSFPSKNLEALSSGKPFISYKLAGIPDEYDAYINYPPDPSVQSLADTIIEACEDKDRYYGMRAHKARQWVLDQKNPKAQAKKILELIERI